MKTVFFYGAIDLKDLIVAREYVPLEELISTSYPYVLANETITDNLERLKDYAEDSIPVLDQNTGSLVSSPPRTWWSGWTTRSARTTHSWPV